MPTPPQSRIVLTHFDWTLARLEEALAKETTEYYKGAALERFRLTYDLALKTIRAFAADQNETCPTDESCFEWTSNHHWLTGESDWKKMIHTYKKVLERPTGEAADGIYAELQTFYLLFKQLRDRMDQAVGK